MNNITYITLGISVGTILVTVSASYAIVKSRQRVYEKVLFAPNGQLNLVPVTVCREERQRCRALNDKDMNNILNEINEIKGLVYAADSKREFAREEQIKFQAETNQKLDTLIEKIGETR